MKKSLIDYGKENKEEKLRAGFIGQRMIVLPRKVLKLMKENPLINQLYITDIGFFPHANHHFRERKHGCKQFILIYCIEGQGLIRVRDSEIYLKSNTFYIIPPGLKHSYYAVQNDPWSIYWVHFSGPQSQNLFEKFSPTYAIASKAVSFEERRINLFENLMDVLEDGYSKENIDYVNISLWQLLGSFIFSNYYVEIGKDKMDGDIINESIKYMKDHINEPLKVDTISGHFNYSNSHFFSLFKKKTGFSPIHYFNHLKIQKACQYLSFTDMSIKEISFDLGYDDPLYFSRLFKKTMNISPLQYRTEYKN